MIKVLEVYFRQEFERTSAELLAQGFVLKAANVLPDADGQIVYCGIFAQETSSAMIELHAQRGMAKALEQLLKAIDEPDASREYINQTMKKAVGILTSTMYLFAVDLQQ